MEKRARFVLWCEHADNPHRRLHLDMGYLRRYLLKEGGYREQRKEVVYMGVEILKKKRRNNLISCYAHDGEHICDVAYTKAKGLFICG